MPICILTQLFSNHSWKLPFSIEHFRFGHHSNTVAKFDRFTLNFFFALFSSLNPKVKVIDTKFSIGNGIHIKLMIDFFGIQPHNKKNRKIAFNAIKKKNHFFFVKANSAFVRRFWNSSPSFVSFFVRSRPPKRILFLLFNTEKSLCK